MTDERYTFEQTKVRLEEILIQVRRKDTSLEQSLELLEEGVRLANICNGLIDQTAWLDPDAKARDGEQRDDDAVVEVSGDDPTDGLGEDTVEAEAEATPPPVREAEDDERD